jgi:hypothetical protein
MFAAGLEGTGHHALQAMMDVCTMSNFHGNKTRNILERSCYKAVEISKLLMNDGTRPKHKSIVTGLFSPLNENSKEIMIKIQTMMKHMLYQKNHHRLYIVGLGASSAGVMSYPNGCSDDGSVPTALCHPDIHLLATMAEASRVDLRIIILTRPADEIIKSVRRRNFLDDFEIKSLISNAAILYAQLTTLDPAFYYCLDYKTLVSLGEEQKQELVEFLHPTAISRPLFDQMYRTVRRKRNATTTEHFSEDYNAFMKFDNISYAMYALDYMTSLIDDLCAKSINNHVR